MKTELEVAADFAKGQHVAPADVTHCVRVGHRGDDAAYAVGWWSQQCFHTATVLHDGERFYGARVAYDTDIERL
jgi:hypothetical protein